MKKVTEDPGRRSLLELDWTQSPRDLIEGPCIVNIQYASQPGSCGTTAPNSTSAEILVIDDDLELQELVAESLREFGYHVSGCTRGDQAVDLIRSRPADLVVLDLGLPGMSGLEVLRTIRDIGNTPVIILTGRTDTADRVVGLEMGADDYVTKPFSPRELTARIGSVLRRTNSSTTAADEASVVVFDDLVIDLRCRDVRVNNCEVDLTAKEFDLLACLAVSPRQVFSKDQLLRDVWDAEPDWQSPSTVAEHIHRLRRKIEVDPSTPRWIHTMRGAGYRLVP